MSPHREQLITGDMYCSIYEKKYIDYVPDYHRVGGIIIAVGNNTEKRIWKEWKWYKHDNGNMFDDRQYVIDMMYKYMKEIEQDNNDKRKD